MLPAHPRVQASLAIEAEIGARWQRELGTFLDGVRAEQPRLDSRVDTLTQEATELRERLQKLSFISTNYNQQLADIQQWTDTLTRAKSELCRGSGRSHRCPDRDSQPPHRTTHDECSRRYGRSAR